MALRKSLTATAIVVVSMGGCGGESSRHASEDDGARGGSSAVALAGSGGTRGGEGGAGQGGGASGCPSSLPGRSKCPAGVPAVGCSYDIAGCSSGSLTLTLGCDENGFWQAAPSSCETGEFCNSPSGGQLHCLEGAWQLGQGGEQQQCPRERPAAGDVCPRGNVNYVPCAFHCLDGSRTVGACTLEAASVWQFNPSCVEDERIRSGSGAGGAGTASGAGGASGESGFGGEGGR